MKQSPRLNFHNFFGKLFGLSTIISLLWACGDSKKESQTTGLSGRFVNQTFLEAIPDSIPGLVPAYCYELNFISPDSVEILYGFEEAKHGYRKSGKDYILIKAMQDKDMPFRVNKDQTISLIDSAWTSAKSTSNFKKSINTGKRKWDFETYLNQQMIAGEYMLYKNEQPTGQKVVFMSDGTTSGIGDFNTYSICYSGDCVGEIYPISNNLTLTSKKQESVTYAFVKDKKSNKLSIRNIEAPIKDMKGERAIKEEVYDLRKQGV